VGVLDRELWRVAGFNVRGLDLLDGIIERLRRDENPEVFAWESVEGWELDGIPLHEGERYTVRVWRGRPGGREWGVHDGRTGSVVASFPSERHALAAIRSWNERPAFDPGAASIEGDWRVPEVGAVGVGSKIRLLSLGDVGLE